MTRLSFQPCRAAAERLQRASPKECQISEAGIAASVKNI
jgi:hypothetical protein